MQSAAQYNFVYDYLHDTLIPYVWNPLYAVPEFAGPDSLEGAKRCPGHTPGQDFYALE